MAEAIIANDNRNFWREARKINCKKKTIPNTIDEVKGDKNISELFADKYNGIYNSVLYEDAMNRIKACVQERLHNNVAECDEVTADDIENVISQLKIGKHDRGQGLESDHLIYSTILLHRILSDFVGFSLRHSHMAEYVYHCFYHCVNTKRWKGVNDLK